MGRIVGIDLGTTNSVVAHLEGAVSQVISNSEGSKTTPSVVFYPEDGGPPVVGEMAKRQLITNPKRTIRSIKRFIGCRFGEAGEKLSQVSYNLEPGPLETDSVRVVLGEGERSLLPEEVSAEVLRKMRQTAEDFFGEEVAMAVVTVPAHFNDQQRQATKKAAELIGLDVLRIINEPTAAALAYGLLQGKSEKIAVFDFGGGTFDISILELDEDVFEVKATNGDTNLGGDNIDDILCEHVRNRIKEIHGIDVWENLQSVQRVREAAEKAKCELSSLTRTLIALPFIVSDETGPKHFQEELTRETFEELILPILDRLIPPCRQAMMDAKLTPSEVSTVLLVGGSTRIPAVQERVRKFFGREPSRSVNPDEAVALGAAIQGGVMKGALREVLLLDVTPLSLGIETQGGAFSVLVPRNSSVPTTAVRKYTTVRDNQETVDIQVCQGERKIAKENRSLGKLKLVGITKAPREVPEIEVKFHIDANGILAVSATDMTSGIKKEVVIESYAESVVKEDVEKVVTEAEAKTEEDFAFLAKMRIKTRVALWEEELRKIVDEHGTALNEEELKTIKETLFRFDVIATRGDMKELTEAETELKELLSRYGDLTHMHMKPPEEPTDMDSLTED
ncbi:MAG: molecular chaperone DnaK [bacterium]